MAMVRIGVLAVAVMSTSLAGAASAQADATSDFLTAVSEIGLNVGDSPADVQLTLAHGAEICELRNYGFTPTVVSRQVPYMYPHATPEQSASFVDAAQTKLCPAVFTPLQPGGY